MPWKRGESGHPGGRHIEKVFSDLFRQVGNEIDSVTGKRKARLLVEKVYALALEGESWAATIVMDRVDGRPQVEAALVVSHQEVKALSDDELLALIAKEQAKAAAVERDKDEKPKLQ
jgi:hypothetical protein